MAVRIISVMYKDKQFKIRDIEEVITDLEMARDNYNRVERIFIADGDALILKTKGLKQILLKIQGLFPECQRVGIYSSPDNILRKSFTELKELKELGLKIAYLGVESGSDKVLQAVKKGFSAQEMIEAGKKIIASGIKLSITLISGLGGKENWKEHAYKSAKVMNEIDPDYLALLTLLVEEGIELYKQVEEGSFELLSPQEVVIETKELIKNLDLTNCIFRSNHASNYLSLAGTLPQDKERLLEEINQVIKNNTGYKSELFRKL